MCIKSSSSTQELSPGSSHQEQQPQPSSPSPSKSAACKAVGKALQGKATHSYQNVTCNAETSLFQLEEKKASSSVTTTASTVEVKEADTNKTKKIESQTLDKNKDMVSLHLSGGCLIDQNKSSNRPVVVIHHHHHHFYPNQNQVINKPVQHSNTYQNLSNIHETLRNNRLKLEESGWYHGKLSWAESAQLLKSTAEGTFLVRDSADPRFLFTLSVQRDAKDGPTSVRIHFSHGKFRLDADEKIEHKMPTFDSVCELVQFYCAGQQASGAKSQQNHVWVDNRGQLYSPICLKQPLMKEVPNLKHLARMAVHKSLKSQATPSVWVPNPIKAYLCDYPHVM